jgi:hypothetical protein
MPQVQLPIFPAGVTHINSEIAFEERDGKVYYFNGDLTVFVHEKNRSGRLEVKLALEIATQVAAGLAAGHEQNLVHPRYQANKHHGEVEGGTRCNGEDYRSRLGEDIRRIGF